MSPFRAAPMTAVCLMACSALLVICNARSLDPGPFERLEALAMQTDPALVPVARQIRATFSGLSFHDAQREWGAAISLRFITDPYETPTPMQRQLVGPFDLWDGEWWRIPFSAFHHVNILHLLMNCSAAWVLGKRLERRWGTLRYSLFLLPAVLIPMLAEFLVGNTAVGFSGAICAMLGAIIVVQRADPRDDDVPDEAIAISLGFILLCIAATSLDIVPVANVAHISGVIYGWVTGWILCGPGTQVRFARPAFIAAHVLVIPALWLATHPLNNGRYLWYLAERNAHTLLLQRESMLQRAVELDPTLTGISLRLAEHRVIEGDLQQAWKVLVTGLEHNPDDTDLMSAARRVWRRIPYGPERDLANDELRRAFGDRADAWSELMRDTQVAAANRHSAAKDASDTALDPRNFPLNQPIDLNWRPERPQQVAPQPVNPDRADSASEGTAL